MDMQNPKEAKALAPVDPLEEFNLLDPLPAEPPEDVGGTIFE